MSKVLRSRADVVLRALLIDARNVTGLSQEQLGERLGHGQAYVWKLENGERLLGFAEAHAYAKELGLEFTEFAARYSAMLRMQSLPAKRKKKAKRSAIEEEGGGG